jgi:murein L,D-transpeptidase YcbB/YkuD
MHKKILIYSLLVMSLVGCATPRTKRETQQLHDRVSILEQELKQKDEKIRLLEKELERKEVRVKSQEKKAVPVMTTKGIQRALKNAGYYKGPIDGNIGQQTKEAIKAFQKANGLNSDGMVGKRTWEKLSKHLP